MKFLVVLGLVVLMGGLSIILSAFHIHFPLARVSFGLFLGWLGLSLFLSAFHIDQRWMAFRAIGERWSTTSSTSSTSTSPATRGSDGRVAETGVVFANDTVDITDIQPGERRKISVIFSDVALRYDPRVPLEIRSTTAFGRTQYPDGAAISFGERFLPAAAPQLLDDLAGPPAHLEINTVFGNTRFVPVNVPHDAPHDAPHGTPAALPST